MAKRLSPRERVGRLKAEGLSNAAIGKAIGRSASTVGRIARGQSSGAKVLGALREFGGLGKRAKAATIEGKRQLSHKPAPAPQRRAAPKPKAEPARVSPMDRADGQLTTLDKAGVDKVMVHLTSGKTGRSITLGAKGGINVDAIRRAPSLGDFLAVQGGRQQYEIDWDDVVDIDIEEFY